MGGGGWGEERFSKALPLKRIWVVIVQGEIIQIHPPPPQKKKKKKKKSYLY